MASAQLEVNSGLPAAGPATRWTDRLWAPVLGGPLRGSWWRLNSRGKLLRVLTGRYEPEQTALFTKHIRPGGCVLDIGAAGGYYSLLAARLVGPTGQVVAFEPDARNQRVLRSHLAANRLPWVQVCPWALAAENGVARFGGGTGSGTGRLCAAGGAVVPTRRLDDVAAELELAPTHLKVDVEGAEVAVLHGGEQTIRRYRPAIFLSTHPSIVPTVHADCCRLLSEWGYHLQPILGGALAETTEVLALPGR